SVIRTSLLLACVLLHACSVTSESDRETCYSRQHRGVTVNIRLALTKGTVMIPQKKPSEKDCILTCCSEDVKPGVKCNLVVYKPVEESSGENCHLFNCPSEQDCPLMAAEAGVNTYNIFRGLTHPTTKVNGRTTAKPATAVNTQLSTTTPRTTTITAAPTTPQTTTSTQQTTTTITTSAAETEEEPTETHVILQTTHMTSTTTTTQPTTTQSTSTVTKARAHQRPAVKPNRKPNKPMRGPESHSFKPTKAKTPTTQPTTTTPTTTTITTTTTTSTTITTSSSAVSPASAGTPVVLLDIESKQRAVDVSSAPGKNRFSRMMWKNSLVAVVVITLIFLLLILALVARKAMESFDRRHYTRLELNDLHYEV
ncbi:MANSC domain-containing protein 1 precursor, partial [Triplophysa rosa]